MKTLITRGQALLCLLLALNQVLLVHNSNAQNAHDQRQLLASAGPGDTAKELHYIPALPLVHGFAHNDYLHQRPLYDALENGFTNIEADVFFKNNKLIIAHYFPFFKGRRTLESLYLKPLAERIMNNGGRVFANYNGPVTLMIDIKSNAARTYEALKLQLEKYRPMLSEYDNGKIVYRAITVVLSGHKPEGLVQNEPDRLVFIDADLLKMPCNTCVNHVFAMASCKYNDVIHWRGEGPMPITERKTLLAFVTMAHKMGTKVRLWASPEKEEVWQELLSCGVDLINTDQLVTLKDYLVANNPLAVN